LRDQTVGLEHWARVGRPGGRVGGHRLPDDERAADRATDHQRNDQQIGPGDLLRPVRWPADQSAADLPGRLVPGVAGGVGANNIGLLVRIAGRVTCRVGNYLWIDDGSNLPDIQGRTGVMVRCLFDPGVSVGTVVGCVGIIEGSIPTGWTPTAGACIRARRRTS